MSVADWKKERTEARDKQRPPSKASSGPGSTTAASDSPNSVEIKTGLTPEQELLVLRRLRTPIDDKAMFGYVPAVPSDEDIQKARDAEEAAKGWEACDRCSSRFQVFPGRREEDGALASGGACTYHPGKIYYSHKQPGERALGVSDRRYRCCSQAVGDSAGCATAATHVFRTSDPKRLALLWNFVETPPNPAAAATAAAVAFDCEMGYSVKGFELIRLTATSWPSGDELLDVLVQPMGEILDLNSRYSGVWPEDMVNAVPFSTKSQPPPPPLAEGERRRMQMVSSPVVARDLLFSLISPDTPLIGHGLENDLNCVRIVHPTIVDTVLLFPHNKGLPVRYGLKALTEMHLHKHIQVETEGKLAGHDSAEDAQAAGDLVRFKIMKEWTKMKVDGWRVEDGELVGPAGVRLTERFIESQPEKDVLDL